MTTRFGATDVHYPPSGGGHAALVVSTKPEFGAIGVAKTSFRAATYAEPLLRGTSTKPLYVTAAGMPLADAAHLVRTMAGSARLPDALRLDRLARAAPPVPGHEQMI